MGYLPTKTILGRDRFGFTLIELAISVAILSVLILLIFQIWISNERATGMLTSKVKMRDEARLGVSHLVRNLRMAESASLRYLDGNDDSLAWPPPRDASDNPTFARGIIFRRPVDLDGDGNPYSGASLGVDWTGVMTIRIDTNDINGDGITLQVVQLFNGVFQKILITDIAPPNRDSNGTMYDTPSVGGFWLFAPDSTDPDLVQISMVQQRSMGPSSGDVVNYYEDFVRVRN